MTTNADVVRRFEDEFKNKANLDIVDELMSADVGREGMKDVGHLVFGAIGDIRVTIDLTLSEGCGAGSGPAAGVVEARVTRR